MQKLLVWLSVKLSTIFGIISTILIIITVQYKIEENNFPLIITMSAIITICLTCYFNNLDDELYKETLGIDDEDEILESRGKSLWLCVLIGSTLAFILSVTTVNTIFSKEKSFIIDGKECKNFSIVNPFTLKRKVSE